MVRTSPCGYPAGKGVVEEIGLFVDGAKGFLIHLLSAGELQAFEPGQIDRDGAGTGKVGDAGKEPISRFRAHSKEINTTGREMPHLLARFIYLVHVESSPCPNSVRKSETGSMGEMAPKVGGLWWRLQLITVGVTVTLLVTVGQNNTWVGLNSLTPRN